MVDRASEVATQGGEPALLTTAAAERVTGPLDPGTLAPGDLVGDRYRIDALLGAGGMGIVYRAEHVAIGKSVAIKVLGGDYSGRRSVVERFMQEARAASSIRHENIVDITDFGHVRDGVPYYVMEYLEGESLAARLRDEGPIPWARARPIMLQICEALRAAHERGVIHRDMKPDNCFLVTRRGSPDFVKVLDFGIAKIVSEGASKSLTQTGVVMGTASYMSPEQAQSMELDPRTDVYSVGVVFYEMLTGRVPFSAQGFLGMLTKHLTEPPPPLRRVAPDAGIPGEVERIVLRALEKDRDARFRSVDDLAEALRAVPLDARPGSRRPWWLGAALVGAVAAVGTFAMIGDELPRDPAATAVATTRTSPDRDAGAAEAPDAQASAEAQTDAAAGSDAKTGADAATGVADEATGVADEATGVADEATVADAASSADAGAALPAASSPVRPTAPRAKKPRVTRKPELTDREIDRALKRARKRAIECGSKHGGLPGRRVEVRFTIAPDGDVTTAKADRLHEGLPLGRCVVEAVKTTSFPPALGSTHAVRRLAVHE